MTIETSQHAKEMRIKVFRHMLETRGWKYRAFLRYLKLFKYLAFAPRRGKFLESYYTLMRYIDDVVDGDVKLSGQYFNEIEYVSKKIDFSKNLANPSDEVDFLMLYCFELANEFGTEFHAETKDILESLLFDAQRKGKWKIFPREELKYHFHLLDIRGTIRATLKIFKDNPEKYKILESLGTACRHQYDIEDIETDLAAGYVNICKEECDLFGISKVDFHLANSQKIRSWLNFHAKEGISLLEKHREILSKNKFSFFEKLVFRLVYENPARKTFKKILSESS
jgi:hypothetical protein